MVFCDGVEAEFEVLKANKLVHLTDRFPLKNEISLLYEREDLI